MDLRNAVILTGRLGADAQVKAYKKQDAATGAQVDASLVEFSLATNRANHTEWHQVVGYGAEHIKHLSALKKGEKVQVNGYIRNDRTKKDGVTTCYPKVVVTGYELMTAKPTGKPAASGKPTKAKQQRREGALL